MRSALLLASTLAIGAIAGPIQKRYMITEVDLKIVTETVYVTAGDPQPTQLGVVDQNKPKSKACSAKTSSPPPPPPSPSSYQVIQPPPPSYEPAPVSPSPSPSPSPKPEEPKPEPTPTPEPPPSYPEQPAPPSPPSTDRPTGPAQAGLVPGPDYQAAVLYHHNFARANSGASPLAWDSTAEANALLAAKTCKFSHFFPNGVTDEGQNLFTVSGDVFNITAGITESWYKSELEHMEGYWGQPSVPDEVFPKVGHLTAILWKGTTGVGCASYDCSGKMVMKDGSQSNMDKYTVCNYSPPGNWPNKFAENVQKPNGGSLGTWSM